MGAIWKLAELVLLDIDRAQRKKRHGFYQTSVTSTPIHLDLDPLEVGWPAANAIKELVQKGIEAIQVRTADGKRRWSNNTGRLVDGLFVMPIRNVGYVIRVPRDRFTKDRWTVESFRVYREKLTALVPALSRPELIFRTTELRTAIEESLHQLIKVEKRLTDKTSRIIGRGRGEGKSIGVAFGKAYGR